MWRLLATGWQGQVMMHLPVKLLRKWKSLSCVWLFVTHGLYSPWNSPGQNAGVGSLSVLQKIFPTQGLNWGLPRCGKNLYQLNHKGNPRILEWVVYPFSSRSSRPRNRSGVSYIAVDSLPTELSGNLPKCLLNICAYQRNILVAQFTCSLQN